MSVRNFTLTFTGGEYLRVGRGSTFLIRSASTVVNVRAVNVHGPDGATRGDNLEFINVGSGFKVKPLSGGRYWEFLEVYSAAANSVEVVVGDEDVEITGNVTVTQAPASAWSASNVTVNATAGVVVAANTGRKKLTLQALATNTASVFLGPNGSVTTGTGIELAPGAAVEFQNTAAVYGISGTAGQSVRVAEET